MGSQVLVLLHALSLTVGLAAAWFALGPASLYALGFFVVFGLLVVYLLRLSEETGMSYGAGALWGVQGMSWVSLAFAFGLLGTLWVCVLAATTRPARALWRRLLHRSGRTPEGEYAGRRDASRAATSTPEPVSVAARVRRAALELTDLDVDTLCMAWRRSYFLLLDSATGSATAAVVEYRQRILDEIGRRDPGGLSRWLASGPRASGNPLPFLQSRSTSDDPGPPAPPSI